MVWPQPDGKNIGNMKTLTLECYLCECGREQAFRFLNAGDVIVEIKRTDTHCVYSVIEGDHSIDEPPSPGLGDMVKSGLSAIGITEERVSKVIGRPCGCGERAEMLNAVGAKYLGLSPGSTAPENKG